MLAFLGLPVDDDDDDCKVVLPRFLSFIRLG